MGKEETCPGAAGKVNIGHLLRLERVRRGMQLQEVALAAGMQPPQLSKIERGDTSPRWTTIERIVRALDVDLADLVVKEASSTKTRL